MKQLRQVKEQHKLQKKQPRELHKELRLQLKQQYLQ